MAEETDNRHFTGVKAVALIYAFIGAFAILTVGLMAFFLSVLQKDVTAGNLNNYFSLAVVPASALALLFLSVWLISLAVGLWKERRWAWIGALATACAVAAASILSRVIAIFSPSFDGGIFDFLSAILVPSGLYLFFRTKARILFAKKSPTANSATG